ncbi:MAG TPA: polysaccharide deacetylase family protein [Bacteroidota bacterium]|nr:polysaccharide deacetylase family protein [Bacteroidota bacterium]
MNAFHKCFLCLPLFVLLASPLCAQNTAKPVQSALILFEGKDVVTNYGRGDAKELAMLLGHFDVTYKIEGVESYVKGEINNFDIGFYIGFNKKYTPPETFMRDVFNGQRQFIWMNTGFDAYSKAFDIEQRYGIKFVGLDTVSNYDVVTAGKMTYTKGEENLNVISVVKGSNVEVLATAHSSATGRTYPYIVRSGAFMYIGDSPFSSATETDRYIYFSDLLHDILGQPHEEIHRALLRIEDVDVFEDPSRLRAIADLLSSKGAPFLVGVIPFFRDPGSGISVSLSDKPEFVDAIHYMIAHGATIVMHGVTHQYQGVTATDFEFWDGSMNRPIAGDTKEYVRSKIKMGLEECWKNNIYPLLWETPHYTASQLDYPVFAEFFSSSMEQRMVIDDPNYSQYFPFIIERDLYGQRIIPENLGYIPYDEDGKEEEAAVKALLNGAKAQLGVRDGFASAFIHPFVELKYMEEYVDGVLDLGYKFMDVKHEQCEVHLKDHVVLTGTAAYRIQLEDQFLRETWLKPDGTVDRWEISTDRVHDTLSKSVEVPTGEMYIAEPSEFREMEMTTLEKVRVSMKQTWDGLFKGEPSFEEARAAILWDTTASGGAMNDQASFAAAVRSVNIPLDTLVGDTVGNLKPYNLLFVPFHSVDGLTNRDFDRLTQFVEEGGCLVTDGKNALAEELGIKFVPSSLKIERMRDRMYPEDALLLSSSEIMSRFEVQKEDEILCTDDRTGAAVTLGRQYGDGKFLFFGIRFDPLTTSGFSRFPYLLEYVRNYFQLRPVLRRENLEVYFDPGFRRNMSVEDVVKRWVGDGIRIVHAAGWHQYPKWTYDYQRLIQLCHANGMLVYAWLEPPHVSQKFWLEHPEWKEVNYLGEPVPPRWRYLMALTDSSCFAEVSGFYKSFLEKYDWDGVNLAELYFESQSGVATPNMYTPMHPSARRQFKRRSGFDPALLFDSLSVYYWKKNPSALRRFEDFRVEILIRLHEQLMAMVAEVQASKPYMELIVTAMDNIGNPELRAWHGVDIDRIIALNRRHKFTLQVEDPQSEWSKDPDRYIALAGKYRAKSNVDSTLMVDLNILQFRSEKVPTQYPTLIQTGIESYELVKSAAMATDRYAIYSESSVRPQDLRMMPYAASASAEFQKIAGGWQISAPFPVLLALPNRFQSLVTGTGQRIFSDDGRFFLPAGDHILFEERQSVGPFLTQPSFGRLLSFTGKISSLSTSSRTIELSYESAQRCIASFSHRPYAFILDRNEVTMETLQGYRRFSVMLPPGDHDLIVILESNASYGVDLTSFWSSWLILGFGIVSCALLLSFYGIVRLTRTSAQRT